MALNRVVLVLLAIMVVDAEIHAAVGASTNLDAAPLVLAQADNKTGVGASSAASRAQAEHSIAIARFLKNRDKANARAGLQQVIAIDPSFAPAYFDLGMLTFSEEKWGEAVRWFKEFRRLDGASDKSILAQLKIEECQRAEEMDRTHEGRTKRRYDSQVERAEALLKAGMENEGVVEAGNATKIDDTRWEAYALAAAALTRQQNYDLAMEFVQKAIDRAPPTRAVTLKTSRNEIMREREYRAALRRGAAAMQAANYPKAAEELGNAARLFPERERTRLAWATTLAVTQQYGKAIELFDQLRLSRTPQVADEARKSLASLEPFRTGARPLSGTSAPAPSAARTAPSDSDENPFRKRKATSEDDNPFRKQEH